MMTYQEIRDLCSAVLSPEPETLDRPTMEDWEFLEGRLEMVFAPEFKYFIDLMSEFSFPGEVYNVARCGRTNGNDTVLTVYESELANVDWPCDLIQFYGIGNGDYFALDRREGAQSAVYYRYHEDGHIEKYNPSFESWLRNLSQFLAGEETAEK